MVQRMCNLVLVSLAIHIVYCFFYLCLAIFFLLIHIKCIHKRGRHTMRWKESITICTYVCNLCAQFRKCKSTFTFQEKFKKLLKFYSLLLYCFYTSFVVQYKYFLRQTSDKHSGMRYSFKELWRLRKIDVLTVWKCCSLSNFITT